MKKDENGTSRGGRVQWPPYHWIQDKADYSIFEDFWDAKYDQHDKVAYERYLRTLELSRQGLSRSSIEKRLGANNIGKYLSGTKRSFLTHLRAEHERLGQPQGKSKWAPIRLKPRGTPDSTWIAVPATISDFQEIVSVLDQRKPTEESFSMMTSFGYNSKEELLRDKVNMFGFFLGVMLGDAGKPVKGTTRSPSRTISLTLSKDKPNSLRFGEFTTLCANASLGLSMHRISDAPSSDGRYTDAECFRWLSPASPLLGWAFKVCMGMTDRQRTTYDPVRMDWIFGAPRDFRVSVFQGMAESDGWVDPGRDMVVFVSSPNEQFFGSLLTGLDVPYQLYQQPPITRIEVPTENALTLPMFSERIHSNNYENMLIMATATTFPPRARLPGWFLHQIQPILQKDLNYNQSCLEIVRTTGYKISSQTVKKYKRGLQVIPPTPSFFLSEVVLRYPRVLLAMGRIGSRAMDRTQDNPMVYASVWSKKTAMKGNKVMAMRLLVVSPSGDLLHEDSSEKTIGSYPGRSSTGKIKELVRAHALLELEGLGVDAVIPLTNISLKNRTEIEDILSRVKSERYQKARSLR